jgi:putative methyltransferase (TIGR04325 family)
VNLRQLAVGLTPPALVWILRRLRRWVFRFQHGQVWAPEWQAIPEGWSYVRTHPEASGWDVPSVVEVQIAKWPRFVAMVESNEPLGIAHESDLADRLDLVSHNIVMSFAYSIALAAHSRRRISFLDWGGGLGHYLLLGRRLLPDVQIEYCCKDLPLLAEQGARLFPDQQFTSDDACLDREYDFVMAGVSLQYSEDWRALLARLRGATGGLLYVTGLPVVAHARSFVFIQRPYEFGYNTEYLAWCLNRGEFVAEAEAQGLRLLREFVVGHRPPISGAAEQTEYRGFLFRPAGAQSGGQ